MSDRHMLSMLYVSKKEVRKMCGNRTCSPDLGKSTCGQRRPTTATRLSHTNKIIQ